MRRHPARRVWRSNVSIRRRGEQAGIDPLPSPYTCNTVLTSAATIQRASARRLWRLLRMPCLWIIKPPFPFEMTPTVQAAT